jgi:hypothetical protein
MRLLAGLKISALMLLVVSLIDRDKRQDHAPPLARADVTLGKNVMCRRRSRRSVTQSVMT